MYLKPKGENFRRIELVWVCSIDNEVVHPSNIYNGKHVRSRKDDGTPLTLCGRVVLKKKSDITEGVS